jgi:very-short-patch-repair endonuclease
VVEVDGPVHDTQADYDENRDAALAKRGLRILRIKNEDVLLRLKETLDLIAAVCQEWMET